LAIHPSRRGCGKLTIDRLPKDLNSTSAGHAAAPDEDEVRDALLRGIGFQKISKYLAAQSLMIVACGCAASLPKILASGLQGVFAHSGFLCGTDTHES